LGRVAVEAGTLAAPRHYRLVAGLTGQPLENDWSVWVMPAADDSHLGAISNRPHNSNSVLVSRELDQAAIARLHAGGRVLLLPEAKHIVGVLSQFTSAYWVPYPMQTLGILCDPKHPALAGFPTQEHTDWQWWDLLHDSRAMIIDGLPEGVDPIVRVIDDWNQNRRLALVFEAKVAHGKLVVCAADITRDLDRRPAARQFRRSLLQYMISDGFAPKAEVTLEALIAAVFGANSKPP
jgi:beta-galactosidase